MRKMKSFKIGKHHTYEFGTWGIDKANENFAFLMQHAETLLDPIMNGIKAVGLDDDLSLEGFLEDESMQALVKGAGSAVAKILAGIGPRDFKKKMREYTEGILCDGKKVEYDTHFLGRPTHLYMVVGFQLFYQYSDFLDESQD